MGWPVKGSENCTIHQGGPAARAAVVMRALQVEVDKVLGFGPVDEYEGDVDLVVLVLRRIAQASARADSYAAEIRRLIAESPTLEEALILDMEGEFGKVGEYVRGIAALENAERDRVMGWKFKALSVGIEAKRVEAEIDRSKRIAEILGVVRTHPALGLSEGQQVAFVSVLREVLGLTAGGSVLEIEGI